ncbi:MAG: ADP-ribosylglycohydrolase family protein [Phycisphaerales bacterium]|nr:ADP-ribosylglycohydrolase family protein [Phycisphaerales bacterium]
MLANGRERSTRPARSRAPDDTLSLGGDIDTIGAMTGAIAGAYHGIDSIPTDWIRAWRIRRRAATTCERSPIDSLATGSVNE